MRYCAAAILLLSCILSVGTVSAADLSIRGGIGYELISQEYFLDSLIEVGQDSIEAQLTLKTSYIDDARAFMRLGIAPLDRGRLDLSAQYEQTRSLYRLKLYGDSRLRLGNHRLTLNHEVELRQRYRKANDPGDEYWYGATRARFDLALDDNLDQYWVLRANFVQFDSTDELTFNQYRVVGNAGFSYTFENFSALSGHFFFSTRQVPDSSQLDYVSFGLESNLLAFYGVGDVDILARLERKDYRQPLDEDDFTRFELLGRNKLEIGKRWWLRQDVNLEYSSFSDSDLVNADYVRTRLVFQAGFQLSDWYVWLGPELEFLAEGQSELIQAADYVETGLRADIDLVSLSGAFLALEAAGGYRNLRFDDDFQSDFWYHRLVFIGDAPIWGALGFDALVSAEWEWHEVDSEDNRLYLVTANLTYDF
ncbi:hypothetical protein GF420_04595 [candidate division GN15 bacterium]|nr:hypothetical protein [candidate division GN15 bacterium]